MNSKDSSFSHVSFHVGGDWAVRCSTYVDTTPILQLDAGPSAVSITTKGKDADEAAAKFARALARAAQRFADELERMHAAQLDGDDDGKAAGRDAA